MKKLLTLLLLFGLISCEENRELADYVNPFIGTDAHGHTYPGATTPFGMVQLSPDTGTEGWDWCSGYHSSDSTIIGFSHTHLSGTGGADLGDILFMPSTGNLLFESGSKEQPDFGYRSRFSHDNETASAGYYSVYLDDYGVKAELTATPRTGIHRYTFDTKTDQHVMIDLTHGIQDNVHTGYYRKIDDRTIEGYRRSNGWADDHTVFFRAEFSQPFSYIESVVDGSQEQIDEGKGKEVVLAAIFDQPIDEVTIKVGISAVSLEGAAVNLKAETEGKDFDQLLLEARAMWNKELAKAVVEGDANKKEIFYTALYHATTAPYLFSDVDGHYRGSDDQIHFDTTVTNYALYSLWDTFRAAHPLYTILQPTRNQQFIQSMIRYWEQSGRLPVWDLNMNENNCMIGYHSVPVIVDSYMKGQRNFDAAKALKAIEHSAMQEDYAGVQYFREMGFLPSDKENNSVSKALEYAYDDWCIAQMAKAMGNDSLYSVFNRRAQFYKTQFDPADKFMKGRSSKGVFTQNFDPTAISILGQGDFTEGSSWHYSFFVPQDVNTLIAMHGGDSAFVAKLEQMFNSESTQADHSPDVSGLIGQYAHGNEPSHHAAYLYSFAGQPWLTQQRVHQILKEMYTTERDGLCGNEDCGQMSAWYVLSAMGFYPVTPGSNQYILGTPEFEKVTLNLENGKQFTIVAEGLSDNSFYINEVLYNDKPWSKSYITHDMIEAGGKLTLRMASQPNKAFGVAVGDRPEQRISDNVLSSDEILSAIVFEPFIADPVRTFAASKTVVPTTINPGSAIYYTTDGSEPTVRSAKVTDGIKMDRNTTLKMRATDKDGRLSGTATYKYYKNVIPAGGVKLATEPSAPYVRGSAAALSDGLMGGDNYMAGEWVGFEGTGIEAIIDLGESRSLKSVAFNAVNEPGSWIVLPFGAEISVSETADGERSKAKSIATPDSRQGRGKAHYFAADMGGAKGRYIHLNIKGGNLPEWHVGKGNKAWLFVDEIMAY